MAPTIAIDAHPLLDARAFSTRFDAPLSETVSPEWLLALLAPDADAPMRHSDEIRQQVRDLLRHGGYKPTGRGKPASEYLLRAAGEHTLGTINAAVDLCNAVSLNSGLPISLIDLDLAREPLRIGIAAAGERYVFNAAGQEIDLEGLLCLFDAAGPCANAVKDSQRTKTRPGTTRTLSVVWGTRADGDHVEQAVRWYRAITEQLGGHTDDVRLQPAMGT